MKNTIYTYIPLEKVDRLRQFIRGSILGDGHIEMSSKFSKNARLKFCHGTKQECYIQWKKNFLLDFDLTSINNIYSYKAISERYKEGFTTTLSFSSKTHPEFTYFYNKYYKNKNRILDLDDISKVDEFALAIWYMDDGHVWNRENRTSRIVLNTCSFSKEEVLFLMELLHNRWNLRTSYYKTNNTIIVSALDCNKFINLVSKYIPDCLSYKKQLVHVKLGELLETP